MGNQEAILHSGWHMLESFTKYKAYQAGKAFFKISASYTSQECAVCGYIHPANRISQSLFVCGKCGNTDNADHNASLVIKKRAITLILDSGTELSAADVLTAAADIGRGGKRKAGRVKSSVSSSQRSVKKEKGATAGCALGSSLL